jgi:hypothetical protein
MENNVEKVKGCRGNHGMPCFSILKFHKMLIVNIL